MLSYKTIRILSCMTFIFVRRISSIRPIVHTLPVLPPFSSSSLPSPPYVNDFFRHWHCIGLSKNVNTKMPFVANIGDLPLVVWRNSAKPGDLSTTINICKHMGSKLNNAKITENGCLKCQYHGFEYTKTDTVGQTVEHEGKIFWAYEPHCTRPHSIPYYYNPEYETSHLQIDMESSLIDSALNTMDIRHPEYVHRLGFGSSNPPQNIKQYNYQNKNTDAQSVGISFDYISNGIMQTLNNNVKITHNHHMYIYPTFSWSHVQFNKKSLLIGVNLLPLSKDRTRWFITIVHNYYKTDIGKRFMQILANTILNQDYIQMRNQAADTPLKRAIMFNKIFEDEETILNLYTLFSKYEYPNIQMAADLYKDFSQKLN